MKREGWQDVVSLVKDEATRREDEERWTWQRGESTAADPLAARTGAESGRAMAAEQLCRERRDSKTVPE